MEPIRLVMEQLGNVQVLQPPGEPGVPLHRCRDLVAGQVEQGWGDIEKMRAPVLAAQRAVRRGKHEHPELGVVARIGPVSFS